MNTTQFHIKCIPCLPDWKSAVSPETVALAAKALKDNQPDFSGTANFIGVGEDGNTDPRTECACHAQMSSVLYRDVIATENATFRRNELSFEQARPFLEWFLYYSPYGFIVLNRDDFESCETLGFVVAGGAPTTLVQSALIVSRHFQEAVPECFDEFNKLVNRGIDGLIAYQLCFNSQISVYRPHNFFNYDTQWFQGYGGHRVSETVCPDTLLNYYKGEVQNPLGGTYKEAPTVYGSSKLFIKDYNDWGWQLSTYRKRRKAFHDYLLEKEGKLDRSGVYKPPNPFASKPAQHDEHKFTITQALTDVADYLQQYVKERLEK
jgi:hypothetical protein